MTVCGIVGYIGRRPALPVVVDGLRRLEYRGYDSAGVAVSGNGRVGVAKTEGRIAALAEKLARDGLPENTLAIGHTRWATHGRPSDANAHPHTDCRGRLAVVHNGIIENYVLLRRRLQAAGHRFRSETDTEVIPHLIEEYLDGDLAAAAARAASDLRGSYAFAVIGTSDPDRLVAVRKDSPLVVGLGDGETFLASDIPAVLRYTRRFIILEDGDLAVLERGRTTVRQTNGRPVERVPLEVDWNVEAAEKGGFPHFMLKEIFEQPACLRQTLAGRLDERGPQGPSTTGVVFENGALDTERVTALNRLFISACGTAYHAGLVGKQLVERLARLPVEAEIASEFRYRDMIMGPGDMLTIVSQSGETADTLAALREACRRGARTVAVTNVVGSSAAREADETVYTRAGPEIAVASTKAYTSQLMAFTLLAVHLGVARGTLPAERAAALLAEAARLPALVQRVLDESPSLREIAARLATWEDIFYIGRGLDWAVAMEGQLKLKEISYIHAEALAAGELKHGTLALIREGIPVIAVATQPHLREKTISNIREVKARGGYLVAVVPSSDTDMTEHADEIVRIPDTDPILAPVLAAVPLQLLAYYAAVARGCDVDKPRNLAKSVTVE